MESSQDSLDSSLGKFSPLSILSSNQTPSKPNLFGSQNRIAFSVNALSLTLAETLVQNSVFSTPTTNPQTIQESNNKMEILEEISLDNNQQARCQYCSADFSSEELNAHIDNCDLRKISCDKCGERILMDIFDIHYEECEPEDMDPPSEINHRYDEDNGESGEMEEEITENNMTYERLLMLDENIVKKGMTQEQLKEFQELLYVKSLDGEGSCVICMSEYQTGEYIRKLTCCHVFHKNCIDQWLGANITCPTCKKELR